MIIKPLWPSVKRAKVLEDRAQFLASSPVLNSLHVLIAESARAHGACVYQWLFESMGLVMDMDELRRYGKNRQNF